MRVPALLHPIFLEPPALEVLPDWRARILSTILLFVALLGTITAIPGIWFSLKLELWHVALFDLIGVTWAIVMWRHPGLSYNVRAWNLLTLTYAIGVYFMFVVGPVSQIYLMAFPVLAAVLLGLRPALVALALNAVTLLSVGYLANTDLHVQGYENWPFLEWVIITANFLLVNTIITISCAALLKGLDRALQRQQLIAQSLNRLAHYDELTGLPNRRLLMDRLAQAQNRARSGAQGCTLLYLDLDRFKNINDARGHASGDALLVAVARRLRSLLGDEDTVARLGGDEFVILSPHETSDTENTARAARAVANKVRQAFEQPFLVDGHPYSAQASIGVVILGKTEQTAEELLRDADTAMYRAKATGRNRIAYFESAMQQEIEAQLALENDLSRAIDQDELSLHLQSQVDASGAVVGAELLLRWNHPTQGAIPPSRFIPIAEDSNLILRLGDWVLKQACRIQHELRKAGHDIPISINVSPRQFHQINFVEHALALLAQHGADTTGLIFEVTEGLLLDHFEQTTERMRALAGHGIQFSIDDFGTGYSSLAYLKRLPLHELKIDRSFVADTPHDPAIVEMMLSMARHLGLRVVAEGVETAAQSEYLAAHGCDAMQGYHHSKPQKLADWLADNARR